MYHLNSKRFSTVRHRFPTFGFFEDRSNDGSSDTLFDNTGIPLVMVSKKYLTAIMYSLAVAALMDLQRRVLPARMCVA